MLRIINVRTVRRLEARMGIVSLLLHVVYSVLNDIVDFGAGNLKNDGFRLSALAIDYFAARCVRIDGTYTSPGSAILVDWRECLANLWHTANDGQTN